MDIVDRAKQLEILQRKKSVNVIKQKLKQQGRLHCIDCDEVIPSARRKVYPAATRCVVCQESYERRK